MVKTMNTEQGVSIPAWTGWLLMGTLTALSLFVGSLVGDLTGFPYYDGYQGSLTQQPLSIALLSLLVITLATMLMLRINMVWSGVLDARMAAALSLVTIAGLSMRAGGMRSIMQAADGPQLFWLLAVELSILLVVVCLVNAAASAFSSTKPVARASTDWSAAGIQAAIFALAMWILGQSPLKAQGVWSVMAAGMLAGFLTHLLIGRTWRWSWCVPLVVGIVGYVANALTATGVDVAKLSGPVAGLALASPLDYAAVGPLGMMLGELLSREHHDDDAGNPANA